MDILAAAGFAVLLIIGTWQLASQRGEITRQRAAAATGDDAARRAVERRVARWRAQRDMLVVGFALLVTGVGLTRIGTLVEERWPALRTGWRVAAFLAVGVVGLVVAVARSGGARADAAPTRDDTRSR